MPRKTKREKIIAKYRKQLKLLQSTASANKTSVNEKVKKQPANTESPIKEKAQVITLTKEEKNMVSFFFVDLKKSLLIIVFILALEISLYFVSMYTNLRLGR